MDAFKAKLWPTLTIAAGIFVFTLLQPVIKSLGLPSALQYLASTLLAAMVVAIISEEILARPQLRIAWKSFEGTSDAKAMKGNFYEWPKDQKFLKIQLDVTLELPYLARKIIGRRANRPEVVFGLRDAARFSVTVDYAPDSSEHKGALANFVLPPSATNSLTHVHSAQVDITVERKEDRIDPTPRNFVVQTRWDGKGYPIEVAKIESSVEKIEFQGV